MKIYAVCLAVLIAACGGGNTGPQVASPGAAKSAKTATLESGAAVLQAKPPIGAINAYLNGFHFYNGNLQGQMEAHHYCSNVNEELIQCVMFDGNTDKARLMGVEYVLSRRLFESLPAEEKRLWHSHVHEVKAGQLIAPGIPERVERELMEKLVGTYGKVWHTWHTDQKLELPTGHPMLMMGFTRDGQVDAAKLADRDRRFGISSAEKRRSRETIPAPPIDAGANAWERGDVAQLSLDHPSSVPSTRR